MLCIEILDFVVSLNSQNFVCVCVFFFVFKLEKITERLAKINKKKIELMKIVI